MQIRFPSLVYKFLCCIFRFKTTFVFIYLYFFVSRLLVLVNITNNEDEGSLDAGQSSSLRGTFTYDAVDLTKTLV